MKGIKQLPCGVWIVEGDTHIGEWVKEHGSLRIDDWLMERVLPHIKEGDTVVDGGANIGDHTSYYAEKVGPRGKVIAFEPNPLAAECLRRNCPEAEVNQCGLGARFHFAAMQQSPNVGASSLEPAADCTGVEVVALDSLDIDRLNFLKLDIEGFEYEALVGGVETIDHFRPKMLIEINRSALERQDATPRFIHLFLKAHNYTWEIVQPDTPADAPQYDILCLPK